MRQDVIISGDSPIGWGFMFDNALSPLLWLAFLIIGIIAWVALARSSLVHGGEMERSDRVPQLYGYSVCLIAIVVMLVNVASLVNTAFTLSDPLASNRFGWGGAVLTSFEAYKATMDQGRPTMASAPGTSPPPPPTDAELRARYEALRTDQIARSKLEARREMTNSVILLIISAALFAWHWRWVRRAEHP
ncbi:MAG: hypothetical protein ACJ79A_06250 [Gemmatimonadaceae bacterium]